MMPSEFISLGGTIKSFDLDCVYEVVRGFSGTQSGWTSLIIYEPTHDTFIELRSSPSDIRGNSKDEAEEVQSKYIVNCYGMSDLEIVNARSNPRAWRLLDRR